MKYKGATYFCSMRVNAQTWASVLHIIDYLAEKIIVRDNFEIVLEQIHNLFQVKLQNTKHILSTNPSLSSSP